MTLMLKVLLQLRVPAAGTVYRPMTQKNCFCLICFDISELNDLHGLGSSLPSRRSWVQFHLLPCLPLLRASGLTFATDSVT